MNSKKISDDVSIYKNLKLIKPKIHFDPKINKIKYKEMSENCDLKTKDLIKSLNNPSMGPRATEKLYPKIYSKFKVRLVLINIVFKKFQQ